MLKDLPQTIQDEVLDMLESDTGTTFMKASKIKQARTVIKLRQKYSFKRNRLGMN
ncbi:MAG: hypothetical protein ACI9J3_002261 [Parvicellaceae bacterium]|jgi:uncharacterized protein YaiL (DUF2058 family)